MLRNLSIFLSLLTGLSINAQNHIDALRYSQESLWGSARYVSMGGAFSSLGANASSTSHNPAGLSIYTTNEFSLSLNFDEIETNSTFYNTNSLDKNSNSSMPNLNYISANIFDPEDVGDWNRFNFGIGYNRLEDYNQDIYFTAEQQDNSFSSYILNNAQGTSFESLNTFREALAFNTYLIDTIGNMANYFSPINPSDLKNQSYRSKRSGNKNEFYLSFATAYQNKLFLGATLGFPSIEYNEHTTLSEKGYSLSETNYLNSFDYKTNLYVSGSGINLKLGLIYKLDKNIRYGFAVHTPTYYELHEEYSSSMNTVLDDTLNLESQSYLGVFEYSLNTPLKVINSLSFVLNKKAIISVDYEYLNYSTARLSAPFYSFIDENSDIKNTYSAVSNLKIGTELRVHEQLSLRAGYAYYESPFAGELNDASREYLTMGLGLKVNQYFVDFAMINSVSEENYAIYEGAQPATINTSKSQVLISAGLKF